MKKIILAAMCLCALSASAIPAKRGVVKTMHQPDGTKVTLTVTGDERCHYYLTEDSRAVIATEDGYYYATLADGKVQPSLTLAHDMHQRGDEELRLLLNTDNEAVIRAFAERPTMMRASHNGVGTTAPNYPTTGERKGLCFLVQYADVSFTMDDPYDYFSRMLNQEGFTDLEATGSCRDYFMATSNGLYSPHFDVYGPVTLPNARSYYGGNDAWGNDKNPQYMMLHAAQALNDEVDFSQYDLDGDGYVDSVFIFYAGEGEAAGGGANTVWPHSWEYSFSNRFDGVRFSKYACGPEMISPNTPDGVGTFCHEFCHVLGLPDLYNTEDPSVNYTPMGWDVMDQGCYANNSRTPPALSAFERNALGWMGDLMVEPTAAGQHTLLALNEGNTAYLIPTSRSNEFFVFENRQQTGWDKYLPYHGMLVWHIDYSASAWRNNAPNNTESHQRIDIVEACNRTYSTSSGFRRYPFPGASKIKDFSYGGTPSFQTWAGEDLGFVITDITETDGVITFNLSGPSGINDITADKGKAWSLNGRHIRVDGQAVLTDISGRVIAAGSGINASLPAPGLYILTVDGVTSKLMVK